MKNNENRGTRRTKERIKAAMVELMKVKSFHQITVQELLDSADVCRSTFYSHYHDIYDLVEEIGNEIIAETVSECRKLVGREYVDGEHPIITEVTGIALKHQGTIHIIDGPNGNTFFAEKLRSVLIETTQEIYKSRKMQIPAKKIDLLSSFVVNGCIGLMSYVSEGDSQYTAEELGEFCGEAMIAMEERIFK